MNWKLLLLFAFAATNLAAQNGVENIAIIPKPQKIEALRGEFQLNAETRIMLIEREPEWSLAAQALAEALMQATGFQISVQNLVRKLTVERPNTIFILKEEKIEQPEGYELEVQQRVIFIRARTAAGAFCGVQTLRQLFPPEIFSAEQQTGIVWRVPACKISDAPRFAWRGMHLDVGRHFFSVADIKKYIDLLAAHKMNTFHWHLTDDQGWRIEIKKYPKLQTVAACRDETLVGHYGDEPQKFDGKKYCGFYTQTEVQEVVEYAKKRFVTVVPEVDVPGHTLAALTAYPELGCIGSGYKTATKWGVFHDVLCAGNDATFEFLENVLDEVCQLFPSEYVHIGGDECPKTRWRDCPKCQKRMRDNNLKDEHELQSYFIQRAGKILGKHGKKIIGWDEILEGGLAPEAAVMSWRGTEGGIAAARQGHPVVMTPTSHCYFDYYQSDPDSEPLAIGGFLSIQKVYDYEPVPAELTEREAKFIQGVQGNVWTEYIPNFQKVEFMAYPRACAMSEVAWTAKKERNFGDFARRLLTHFERLEAAEVNFSKAFFDVAAEWIEGKIRLKSNTDLQVGESQKKYEIRYTTDGSEPRNDDKIFAQAIDIQADGQKFKTVRAAVFQDGKKMGKTFSQTYQLGLATGKPYTMSQKPVKYTGSESLALTNGISGTFKKWNLWVGLEGKDIDPTIDLGSRQPLKKLTTHFVNGRDFWIYPPRNLEVFVSDDGKNFRSVARREIDFQKLGDNRVELVSMDLPSGTAARFVRLVAANFGKIPNGAAGEGNPAWLFLDEIILE